MFSFKIYAKQSLQTYNCDISLSATAFIYIKIKKCKGKGKMFPPKTPVWPRGWVEV